MFKLTRPTPPTVEVTLYPAPQVLTVHVTETGSQTAPFPLGLLGLIVKCSLSFPAGRPLSQVCAAEALAAPRPLCRVRSGGPHGCGPAVCGAACLPVQEPDREAGSRQTGLAGWGPALGSCD